MNFDCGPVSVWLDPDGDCICAEGQAFEYEARKAWTKMVRPNSWAIDVGAHTGLYAIAAAKLDAFALAIEPQPKLAERILENARTNHVHLNVIQAAASDHEGREPFAGSGKDTDGIFNPLVDKPEWIWTTVKTVRLDDLIPEEENVSAIKIDVERHERFVIAGCQRIIAQWRPKMIVEVLNLESKFSVLMMLDNYQHTLLDERNLLLVPND